MRFYKGVLINGSTQSEDHKATVETIRVDYAVLVEKIKELKTMEFEASVEARDTSK